MVWRRGDELESTLRAGLRMDGDGKGWVRFAPLPERGVEARLRVLSVDGLWMAEAPAGDVDLVWTKCARWTGVLKDAGGKGVGGSWVELDRLDEKKGVRERRRARCDAGGKYVFDALGAGTWKLSGDPLRFAPFESELREVKVGEVTKLSVTLEAAREVAPVNGRIEGVGEGMPVPGEPTVVLRRAGDVLPQESVRAAWKKEGGRYVALFIVPRLPIGEYELELVPAANDVEGWGEKRLTVKAGGSVVFTHR
jgi:hypothetical protein